MTRAQYLRMASRLGLGPQEAMGMRPGLMFDMWELLVRENKTEMDN